MICHGAILKLRPVVSNKQLGFSLVQRGANRLSSTKETLVVSETVGRRILWLVPFYMDTNDDDISWEQVSILESQLKKDGWLKANQSLEVESDYTFDEKNTFPNLETTLWEEAKKLKAKGFLPNDKQLEVHTRHPFIPIWARWVFALFLIETALEVTETLQISWDLSNLFSAILGLLAILLIGWLFFRVGKHFDWWSTN